MYLADTNIFLEALLGQDKKDDVQSFLQTIDLRHNLHNGFVAAFHRYYSVARGPCAYRLKNFALSLAHS